MHVQKCEWLGVCGCVWVCTSVCIHGRFCFRSLCLVWSSRALSPQQPSFRGYHTCLNFTSCENSSPPRASCMHLPRFFTYLTFIPLPLPGLWVLIKAECSIFQYFILWFKFQVTFKWVNKLPFVFIFSRPPKIFCRKYVYIFPLWDSRANPRCKACEWEVFELKM